MNTLTRVSSKRIRPGALIARCCLGIVVTLGAASCAPAPDPAAATVEYYRSHASARAATVAECANSPGTRSAEPDCVNAIRAEEIESVGSLRELPPLGLSPEAAADRSPRELGASTPND